MLRPGDALVFPIAVIFIADEAASAGVSTTRSAASFGELKGSQTNSIQRDSAGCDRRDPVDHFGCLGAYPGKEFSGCIETGEIRGDAATIITLPVSSVW